MPKYEIRAVIVDTETGEEVCRSSGPVYSTDEDTVRVAYSALGAFHGGAKESHEAVHYPTGVTEELPQF